MPLLHDLFPLRRRASGMRSRICAARSGWCTGSLAPPCLNPAHIHTTSGQFYERSLVELLLQFGQCSNCFRTCHFPAFAINLFPERCKGRTFGHLPGLNPSSVASRRFGNLKTGAELGDCDIRNAKFPGHHLRRLLPNQREQFLARERYFDGILAPFWSMVSGYVSPCYRQPRPFVSDFRHW
jgi:hypothetical protein